MFSLKPPRPTFKSYLLPPPQVNNPLPASAPVFEDSGPAGPARGSGGTREAIPVPLSLAARLPPLAREKLVKLRRSHSVPSDLPSVVLSCDETRGSIRGWVC